MGVLTNRKERGHVGVITCYQNDAEIVLEPTSSLTKANRRLVNMKVGGFDISVSLCPFSNIIFLEICHG